MGKLDAEFLDALSRRQLKKVEALLVRGADPDARFGGREEAAPVSALLRAAERGWCDAVALLLRYGATLELDDRDVAAWSRARSAGHTEVCELLERYGAPGEKRYPPRLRRIHEACGMFFVHVPAGTYTVGAPPRRLKLKVGSRRQFDWPCNAVPEQQVSLKGFWISTDVLRLRHWHALKRSRLAGKLKGLVGPKRIKQQSGNIARYIHYGSTCYKRFPKDQLEEDPALCLEFGVSQRLARALGTELPRWTQWEAAARGPQASLYPWGDTWEVKPIRLERMSYRTCWEDPETTMGLWRESSEGSETVVRAKSFGWYGRARSPFGLEGLLRWGMEWNTSPRRMETLLWSLEQGGRILRSLADLGTQQSGAELPGSIHRAFSGTMLPMFTRHEWSLASAFRLVL